MSTIQSPLDWRWKAFPRLTWRGWRPPTSEDPRDEALRRQRIEIDGCLRHHLKRTNWMSVGLGRIARCFFLEGHGVGCIRG